MDEGLADYGWYHFWAGKPGIHMTENWTWAWKQARKWTSSVVPAALPALKPCLASLNNGLEAVNQESSSLLQVASSVSSQQRGQTGSAEVSPPRFLRRNMGGTRLVMQKTHSKDQKKKSKILILGLTEHSRLSLLSYYILGKLVPSSSSADLQESARHAPKFLKQWLFLAPFN